MPHNIHAYELSDEADLDIGEIFDYSADQFGIDQAVIYASDLDKCFESLVKNPELGRDRSEIIEGLRSISSGSHVVFYRILSDKIRIVRILHGSRDVVRHFLPT